MTTSPDTLEHEHTATDADGTAGTDALTGEMVANPRRTRI